MFFKGSDELNIIVTENRLLEIKASDLLNNVSFLSSNCYFFCNDCLYGVVDLYDVFSIDDVVRINSDFFYLSSKNYYEAKNLIDKNNRLEVPVIEGNKFVGAYVYGCDYSSIKDLYSFFSYNLGNNLALISCKYDMFCDFVVDFFSDKSIDFISLVDFFKCDWSYDMILCKCESEFEVLYHLCNLFEYPFYFYMCYSLYDLYNEYETYAFENNTYSDTLNYLKYLKSKGVFVFNLLLNVDDEKTLEVRDEISNRFLKYGMSVCSNIVEPNKFFDKFYSKDYYDFFVNTPFDIKKIDGINVLNDYRSKYYNVFNGKRVTIGSDIDYVKTIHIFGSCIIIGRYVEDKYTLSSIIQKFLNDDGYPIRVVNHGAWNNSFYQLKLMSDSSIKSGDVVIVFDDNRFYDGIPIIDLTECFYENKINSDWFVDTLFHFNHIVSGMYAKKIYDKIKFCFDFKVKDMNIEKIDDELIVNNYIQRYFSNFNTKYQKIGSIVMNANPFTNGHLFLVEEALKKVDFLIIFVLSENKSFFSFEDRLSMVIEGTKNFNNVLVVPSGDAILSNGTFPEYFLKVIDDNIEKNIIRDLKMFSFIAKKLNITYRFIGTEPSDLVTKKYNELMFKYLSNINVIEIKRKNSNNNVISASLVREFLKREDYESIKNIVPLSTYLSIKSKVGLSLFDKSYFVFVIDDCGSFTFDCFKVFHELGVPLCVACIVDNLDVSNGYLSIKDVLKLVVLDGGEVLAHYYGNLADIGYSDGVHDFLTSDEDWYLRTGFVKNILLNEGFNVRGLIRADYTQKKSFKGEKFCRKYFEYSDNVGISKRYNLGDRKFFFDDDMSSIESAKRYIDKCFLNPGFYSFCLHGNEPLANYSDLYDLISYVIKKGVITTYSEMYDKGYFMK